MTRSTRSRIQSNRKKRRNLDQLSVSLFPFLAVLICTLGVLIVMLVMAAKNADLEAQKAETESTQEHQQQLTELQNQLDTKQLLVDGLLSVRPEITKRLQHARNLRGYLEKEIRDLEDEAQLVESQIESLAMALNENSEKEVSDEQLQAVKDEIESVTSQLAEVKQVSFEAPPVTYSIVPHRGPGGTHRRPIFLECLDDRVTIQPFGIPLTSDDFPDLVIPGNPLDSALLTIREYWKRYDLAGTEGNPYPLIVIRPSGSRSYVAARRAMKSWEDEFGYEIVEADKVLDFGKPDPQLKDEIESAIARARKVQATALAANRHRKAVLRRAGSEMGIGSGFRASASQGGFVSNGGFDSENSWKSAGDQSPDGMPDSSEANTNPGPAFDNVLDRYRNDQASVANSSRSGRSNPAKASTTYSKSGEANLSQVSKKNAKPTQAAASANGMTSESGKPGGGNLQIASPIGSSKSSMAESRGQNWALPSKTPGAVGYLRPIRIICTPLKLGVLTSSSPNPIEIDFSGTTEDAIDELIDIVWKSIENWGSAGENAFWKPELRVSVQPQGEQRFQELQALLRESGLEVSEVRR